MIDPVRRRCIGKTGISVSALAFGCWAISGAWGTTLSHREIYRVLDAAWKAGVNLFDTAPVYGNGLGETILGSRPWRNKAIIATKISARPKPSPPIESIKQYYTHEYILRSVESSLTRLKRDHIDILQLHNWYNEWDPEAEYVFSVFQDLKQEGKIRAIGVSLPTWMNGNINQLLRKQLIDVVQVPLNLFQQWAVERVIGAAQRFDVGVFARSPLDHGSLATLAEKIERLPDADFRKQRFGGNRTTQLRNRIRDICKSAQISTERLPYFAIAYCLVQAGITSVIVGMRTVNQIRQNTNPSNYEFSVNQLEQGRYFQWARGW